MRAPLIMAAAWQAVMEAANGQCQCAGGLCGSRHTKDVGLRCSRTVGLVAAPGDLRLSDVDAARVPARQLRAWCSDCHRKAAARQRAADRERARRQLADNPPPALF
jgi:hypothetical protein